MRRRYFFGLGNPGPRYAATRHNIGWWVLDKLARRLDLPESGSRHRSVVRCGMVGDTRVTLAWPDTFMNLSGECLAQWKRREGMDPASEALVVLDDMDLPPGKLRLRLAGSGGSHNGMKDIVERLGTRDVPRLRLGVGRPADPADWADYCLAVIPKPERAVLEEAAERAAECCLQLAQGRAIGELVSRMPPA